MPKLTPNALQQELALELYKKIYEANRLLEESCNSASKLSLEQLNAFIDSESFRKLQWDKQGLEEMFDVKADQMREIIAAKQEKRHIDYRIFDEKSNPGQVNKYGNTALIYSCLLGLESIATKLIKTGKSNPR